MPSRSLRRLQTRLRDVDQLLHSHTIIGGTGRGRRWNLESLNRAGLVLCTAHLEGFLEDLFEEGGKAILKSRIGTSRVPIEMKLIAVRGLADSIRDSPDRQKREEALREMLRKAGQLAHPRRLIHADDIDLRMVSARFGNPTANAIDRLFSNMGIAKILANTTWQGAGERTIRKKVNALVEKRNRIAHGTLGVVVSRHEVERYRRFLQNLAERMDETVREQVASVIGRNPWR